MTGTALLPTEAVLDTGGRGRPHLAVPHVLTTKQHSTDPGLTWIPAHSCQGLDKTLLSLISSLPPAWHCRVKPQPPSSSLQ